MLMQLLGFAESEWKCWICSQREKVAVPNAPRSQVRRASLPRTTSAAVAEIETVYSDPQRLQGYDELVGFEATRDPDQETVHRHDRGYEKAMRTAQMGVERAVRKELKEQQRSGSNFISVSSLRQGGTQASLNKAYSDISGSSGSSDPRARRAQSGFTTIFESAQSAASLDGDQDDNSDQEKDLEELYNEAADRIRHLPRVTRKNEGVRAYKAAVHNKLDRLGVARSLQGDFQDHADVAGVVREGVRTYYQQTEGLGSYYPNPGDEQGTITFEQRAELQRFARALSRDGGFN